MNFAIRITNLCRFLIDEKHEHKISDGFNNKNIKDKFGQQ